MVPGFHRLCPCLIILAAAAAARGGDCNGNSIEDSLDLAPGELAFAPVPSQVFAFRPSAVVASHLDRDGDFDLATLNAATGTASVLLNGGGGSFLPPRSFPTGESPSVIAAGDLDGDGASELAIASGFAVLVLRNDGRGGMGFGNTLVLGTRPRSIVCADLDGDRDLDLATANEGTPEGISGNASVILSDGAGRLGPARNFAMGDAPHSIAAADLDRDGDLDLISAELVAEAVSIVRNDGDGTFARPVSIEIGLRPDSLVAGDFDKDGSPDLAAAGRGLAVLFNAGDGTFRPPAVSHPIDNPASLAAGDFDGDQHLDLVLSRRFDTATQTDPQILLLRNDGRGSFAGGEKLYVSGFIAPKTSMAAGDFDGNGALDLAAAGESLTLLLNRGAASMEARELFTMGRNPAALRVADFDTDGHLDLAAMDNIGSGWLRLSVLLNDGHGELGDPHTVDVDANAYQLLASDLDGDGDSDLAFTELGSNLRVAMNPGDGGFSEPLRLSMGVNSGMRDAGDLDGDGRKEFLVVAGTTLVVASLSEEGSLVKRTTRELGTDIFSLKADDLDGDLDTDIALLSWRQPSSLFLFWNDGQGGLSQPAPGSLEGTGWIHVGDIDVDGDRDLLLLNGEEVTVFLNDGNRAFKPGGAFPTSAEDLAVSDADGDGDFDLAVPEWRGISFLLNDGRGSLSRPVPVMPVEGFEPLRIASGDIDGNGLDDIFFGRGIHFPMTVLRNFTQPPFSRDRNSNAIPDECERDSFRRGDVVADAALDLSDAIHLLRFLFLGDRLEGCPDAADADDDGRLAITDPLSVLGTLFLGRGPLPPPQICGLDPTHDELPPCDRRGC